MPTFVDLSSSPEKIAKMDDVQELNDPDWETFFNPVTQMEEIDATCRTDDSKLDSIEKDSGIGVNMQSKLSTSDAKISSEEKCHKDDSKRVSVSSSDPKIELAMIEARNRSKELEIIERTIGIFEKISRDR